MKILALDLSKRSTGFAHWDQSEAVPVYGSECLGSEFTSDGWVFTNLHQLLTNIESAGEIDAIFYEDAINILPGARNTNVHAIKLASGLIAHVESWGFITKTKTHAVNMKSWRRSYFGNIGRGHARAELKDFALERSRQLGFKPRNDDEADALGILDYGCSYLDILPPWRKSEVLRPPLRGGK